MANLCTVVLFDEISSEPYVSWFDSKLDELNHYLYLDFTNMDLRFVDYDINYSFGMKMAKLSIQPGVEAVNDLETLGAFPKHVTVTNKTIYCNPVAQMRSDGTDDDKFMTIDTIDATMHIPDLHSCLFQPGFLPFGKGKRLRFTAHIDRAKMVVHEKQAEMFFYHGLRVET